MTGIIMKRNWKFYCKLFFSTFYLSAFTFGGGFVIVALMRKKFVEQYHWIEEKEMLDLVAIAQSSPGAIAVNASILVGYRLAGIPGAIISIIGTVLPPLIILSILSSAYTAFRDNRYVQYLLGGMQAGVTAVIFDVVISMAAELIKERKRLPVAVMIAAFAAAIIFKVNVIIIIFACGLLGIIFTYAAGKTKKGGGLE